MYITICEIDHQSRFDAWDRALRAGALGWPWGMGWGRGWRGLRMGNTCTPMADSCDYMAKPPQYCKIISLQLKLKKKKKEYWSGLPFPSPGDLLNTVIKPGSPTLQADSLPSEPPGAPALSLVICLTYDNIHVSMLFSQIIPPLPSPTETKSLFFTSVSLLLSCI